MDRVKKYIGTKLIVFTLLFIISMFYEQAIGQRLIILFGCYGSIVIISYLLKRFQDHPNRIIFLILMEIAMVLIMEIETKYVVNYFFHFLYILVIIEGAYLLKEKKGILIGIIAILASFFKYIYVLSLDPNYSNISEMFFAEIALVLILLIVYLFNKYDDEKRKGEEQVKTLILFKERKRLARDLHDILGHQLTSLIMQLEMLDHQLFEETQENKAMLRESKLTAREALRELRMVVEALHNTDEDLYSQIEQLIDKYNKRTGIQVNLNLPTSRFVLSPMGKYALFHMIEESLTNSVKHGKATRVDIELKVISSNLNFKISNNGSSIATITPGNGLKGMLERIENTGGHITFDGSKGFVIEGFLPLEEDSND